MQALAQAALDSAGGGFLASFLPFANKIARLGVQNSLMQTGDEADTAGHARYLSGL